MTVQITPFTEGAEAWDAFVASQPGATHAHRMGWLEVIRDTFGHDVTPLATPTAVLPLVHMSSALFGRYLVSVPFLNYGGPLGDAEGVRALAEHAVALGRSAGVKLVELRSRIEQPIDLPVSRRKITVVLDLPSTEEEMWKRLPSKLRSQVRRPEKEGVTVRFGADQVSAFHRVFVRHMRDLGTPSLPLRFFEHMTSRFGDDAWFAAAYLGEEPVAAGAGIRWNGESEIIWASSLRKYNRIAPNMLVYWEAMRHAIAGGCRVFNFGRCSPGTGAHRFKSQWGGRDEPLWWYQDSPAGVTATPNPDQGAFRLAVRAWQFLPVPVARTVGPWIIRGIP